MVNSESALVYHHRMDPEGLMPVLQPGEFNWPISFFLPPNIPPSFTGKTRVDFSVVHRVRVVVRQKGVLVNNDVEEIVAFTVKQPVSPMFLRQLPFPQTEFIQKLEKSFWRSGGEVGVQVNILNNILVAGESCEVKVDVDMKKSESKIRSVEVRLMQRVQTASHADSNWDNQPLTKSLPNADAIDILPEMESRSIMLQLPIPPELEMLPSVTTQKGTCEYYVLLFITPEHGDPIRRLFRMPLTSESSLKIARSAQASMPSMPPPIVVPSAVYSAPPSVTYNAPQAADGAEPPPYNPSIDLNLEAPSAAPPAYQPPVYH